MNDTINLQKAKDLLDISMASSYKYRLVIHEVPSEWFKDAKGGKKNTIKLYVALKNNTTDKIHTGYNVPLKVCLYNSLHPDKDQADMFLKVQSVNNNIKKEDGRAFIEVKISEPSRTVEKKRIPWTLCVQSDFKNEMLDSEIKPCFTNDIDVKTKPNSNDIHTEMGSSKKRKLESIIQDHDINVSDHETNPDRHIELMDSTVHELETAIKNVHKLFNRLKDQLEKTKRTREMEQSSSISDPTIQIGISDNLDKLLNADMLCKPINNDM